MMVWQGYVRAISRRYQTTVVISYTASRPLYDNCVFVPHSLRLSDSGFGLGAMSRVDAIEMAKKCTKDLLQGGQYDLLVPQDLNRITRLLIGRPAFVRVMSPLARPGWYDIAFHFRQFERAGDRPKSYPRSFADELAAECVRKGWKVVAIGHPDLAYCPPSCEDQRSVDMNVAIRMITSSRIVVGGSSAPMHLASLCGAPIVVWIGNGADIERYRTYWNPHGSTVHVVTDRTFQPRPTEVLEHVERALQGARMGKRCFT